MAIETVIIPQKIGKRLSCVCGHTWIYLGKSEFYASCPKCRTTVTLQPKRKKQLPQAKEQEKSSSKKPLRTTPTVGHHVEQSPIVKARVITHRGKEVLQPNA